MIWDVNMKNKETVARIISNSMIYFWCVNSCFFVFSCVTRLFDAAGQRPRTLERWSTTTSWPVYFYFAQKKMKFLLRNYRNSWISCCVLNKLVTIIFLSFYTKLRSFYFITSFSLLKKHSCREITAIYDFPAGFYKNL